MIWNIYKHFCAPNLIETPVTGFGQRLSCHWKSHLILFWIWEQYLKSIMTRLDCHTIDTSMYKRETKLLSCAKHAYYTFNEMSLVPYLQFLRRERKISYLYCSFQSSSLTSNVLHALGASKVFETRLQSYGMCSLIDGYQFWEEIWCLHRQGKLFLDIIFIINILWNNYNIVGYPTIYLNKIFGFWTLSIVLFLFKTQRFGDWILSPSSGKTYSVGPNRQS
jgi:hypothetical protein